MKLKHRMSELRTVMGILHGSRTFGGPIQAYLGLSNRCSTMCLHCYYYSPLLEKPTLRPLRKARKMGTDPPSLETLRKMQRRDADFERTSRLIDELIGMDVWRFVFSGSGEPFLNANALDFMHRTKHADCECIVNTSGTKLNKEKIDEMIAMGLDEIRITTLAGTPETYKRTHPKAKDFVFDRLHDNLRYLAERKKALGVKRPHISLFTIVISENYDSLMDFAKFAVDVQAARVIYRPYDDVEDPGLAALVPSAEQAAAVREQLAEVRPFLDSQGTSHNIDNFLMICDKQIDTSAIYRIIPCYYGWAATQILANGKVFPCGRSYDSFGDIYQEDFRKIWNGEAYRKFRAEGGKLNKRETTVSGADCNRCPHHSANLRVYHALHPFKRHAKELENLSPGIPLKLA